MGCTASNTTLNIVILGLDGAGKTTLLYKVSLFQLHSSVLLPQLKGKNTSTIPTSMNLCLSILMNLYAFILVLVGFNLEEVEYNELSLLFWDIGGQPHVFTQHSFRLLLVLQLRELWPYYLKGSLFVSFYSPILYKIVMLLYMLLILPIAQTCLAQVIVGIVIFVRSAAFARIHSYLLILY